jgi:hypothetical protein
MSQNLSQILSKNPIYHKGISEDLVENYYRNHNCNEYDDCLIIAAHENSFLDCSLCPHKDARLFAFLNHPDFLGQ